MNYTWRRKLKILQKMRFVRVMLGLFVEKLKEGVKILEEPPVFGCDPELWAPRLGARAATALCFYTLEQGMLSFVLQDLFFQERV